MYKNLKWKLVAILVVTGLAVWSFTPPSRKISLGLDLKGGVHFVLAVQTNDALKLETETASEQLRQGLKDKNITVTTTPALTEFTVQGVSPQDDQQFRALASNDLGDFCYATPPISNGRMLVRAGPNLFCIAQN